jgi:hypothetical protein
MLQLWIFLGILVSIAGTWAFFWYLPNAAALACLGLGGVVLLWFIWELSGMVIQ